MASAIKRVISFNSSNFVEPLYDALEYLLALLDPLHDSVERSWAYFDSLSDGVERSQPIESGN